jgi:site-specific DNA recombinase
MNAYGITRVSTISQKENTSLEFQKKRIEDYSKLYGINLKGIIEETISGGTDFSSREGINTIKEMIGNGDCNVILVNKIDRLGRSLLEGLQFLKFCEEHAVRVISISESIDTDNPQSKLITNILWSIAEHEISMIKSRLSDGRLKRFEENKKPYGALSFGYRKNHKGLIVIDEEESKIIQYIYKRYNTLSKIKHLTKTKRTQKLLHSLKVKGHKFRGKEFKWWNVNKILSNPFYCGVMNWKDKTTTHNYDTIISKRMFNQIKLCRL